MSDDPRLEEVPCLLCGGTDATVVARGVAQMHATPDPFQFVACRNCTLVRLNPRVRIEDIGRYYDATYLPHRGGAAWGRYAGIVEKTLAATDRARVRRLLSVKRLTPGSRVLDLGCGRPTFLRSLRDVTGARGVGIDFSSEAWTDDPQRWEGLELHRGTLETIALDKGFDAFTLWHSLEHEYAPLETLVRLRALAAPGAALVVEVPNYDSFLRRWHGSHWSGFHTPRHTAVFSPATLTKLIEKAGWKVERHLPYGTIDPYSSWWLGRQERTGRGVRGDLSDRFFSFAFGKFITLPITVMKRRLNLGPQTAFARA